MVVQSTFIVIEGADGSGKTTQFKLLQERLLTAGYDVEVFDFPQYDKPSSHFVRQYLNGEYGPASKISPYTASLFYALDRYEAADDIKRALEQGKIVLANRYVAANMAHQGAKINDPADQRGFFVWEDSLEFQLLGIPRPTINVFLHVPVEVSIDLIKERAKASGTEIDEHEKDIEHLRKATTAYEILHKLFPKDFRLIESVKKGQLLPPNQISDNVWEIIKPLLPQPPANPSQKVSIKMEALPIPAARQEKPSAAPSPELEAREMLLEIEDISMLAATEIELNQQLHVRVELPWKDNQSSKFYTPTNLATDITEQYKSYLSQIRDHYFNMLKSINDYYKKHQDKSSAEKPQTKKALRGAVPLAALTKVSVAGSKEDIKALINMLRTHNLDEMRLVARRLQALAHEVDPEIFSKELRDENNSAPEALSETIARLAQSHFPQTLPDISDEIDLLHISPRNEFELIAAGVYSHTTLAPENILTELEGWPYEQKKKTLQTVIKEAQPQILSQAKYQVDAVFDRVTLQELLEDRLIEGVKIQPATPRFGYNVDTLIEEISIEDNYLECFDASLTLYSVLQEAGKEEVAGYATLLGHKIRCQFTISGKAFLQAKPKRSYRDLLGQIKEKVSENHPLIATELANLLASSQNQAKSPKVARHKKRSKKS
jgi:dTMP kinase